MSGGGRAVGCVAGPRSGSDHAALCPDKLRKAAGRGSHARRRPLQAVARLINREMVGSVGGRRSGVYVKPDWGVPAALRNGRRLEGIFIWPPLAGASIAVRAVRPKVLGRCWVGRREEISGGKRAEETNGRELRKAATQTDNTEQRLKKRRRDGGERPQGKGRSATEKTGDGVRDKGAGGFVAQDIKLQPARVGTRQQAGPRHRGR
jgi:hypothetical protein